MTMPAILTFDVSSFRTQFPAFGSPLGFPDATLQMYWDMGTNFVSNINAGVLNGAGRQLALNLMTAHLTALSVLIASGQTPVIVQGSTIDKVSVTLTPPPVQSQFRWWLNTTPYGMELLTLLQVRSAGGFYIGGAPELSAFRIVGGGFGSGGRVW